MLTERTPINIKIPVKMLGHFTGETEDLKGYLFKPSEKDQLSTVFLAGFTNDDHIYEVWKDWTPGGHVYLANTDPVFNPQTTFLRDKGHTQLLGYFLTETSLEEKGYLESSGGWTEIDSSHPIIDIIDSKIDDIPDHMFLTSWLAAGNVFTVGQTARFGKWLAELGLSLNKRIRIMNSVSFRGVDLELFDSALKYHLEGMDEKCQKKVTKHYDEVRKWIEEVKMRK